MHRVMAQLELSGAEMRVVQEVAAAYGLEQQEFLDRCLARGIMVAEQDWYDAWQEARQPEAAEDDLPF